MLCYAVDNTYVKRDESIVFSITKKMLAHLLDGNFNETKKDSISFVEMCWILNIFIKTTCNLVYLRPAIYRVRWRGRQCYWPKHFLSLLSGGNIIFDNFITWSMELSITIYNYIIKLTCSEKRALWILFENKKRKLSAASKISRFLRFSCMSAKLNVAS